MNPPSQQGQEAEMLPQDKANTRFRRRPFTMPEQAMSLDPFPWYRMMRESNPVYYDQENELWNVFRYKDTQHILTDPATFSSEVAQRLMTDEEVGAPLSRLEAKIALSMLLARFRNIRRDQSVALKRIPAASAFFGVQKLPVTFTLS